MIAMRFITAFLAIAWFTLGWGKLTLSVDTVNFGTFREADGKKTVRTYVVNLGEEPALIKNVRSTCGCTVADHDKEEILPGDSAWVDITYNPSRRPGKFKKNVRVYDYEGESLVIPVEGVVIGTPETMQGTYPVDAGPLRLTERTLLVPEIKRDDAKYLFINAYNISDRPLTPNLDSGDDAVETTIYPESILPGEIGTLGFYINPRKEKRSGNVSYAVKFTPAVELPVEPITLEIHINITEEADGSSRK